MIPLAVKMTAGQVILGAYLAGINNGCAKKDIALGLALVKGVVLVADRVVLFPNAQVQGIRIQIKSAQFRKAFLVMGRGLRNHACIGLKRDAARQRRIHFFHLFSFTYDIFDNSQSQQSAVRG